MVDEGLLMIIPEKLAIHEPKKELLKIINNKKYKDKILFESKSTFHDIKVVENEIGRFLHYNNTYQAGFINTDFYKGNLPYINYFLLPYFYKNSVKKVLLIGLGSGKIVSDLFKIYSEIQQFDIVDIEENILDIAKDFFDFKPNSRTNFYLQDALVYLRLSKTKYDLIIVDVAGDEGIDERFISEEYFRLIKTNLKKSGIFVSNLCSGADLYNSKNIFFKKLIQIYKKNFLNFDIYKGDYSDKIYYKSFFGIDERVIDITNLIILSSNTHLDLKIKDKISMFKSIFDNIDIDSILLDKV